jgi:hypothetical protein
MLFPCLQRVHPVRLFLVFQATDCPLPWFTGNLGATVPKPTKQQQNDRQLKRSKHLQQQNRE